MKALTVQQPWAFEICSGRKTIENRDWKPAVKAPFTLLIHAGKNVDEGAWYQGMPDLARFKDPSDRMHRYHMGVVEGIVTVRAIHAATPHLDCCRNPWAMPARYHWELSRARFINPIPYRGSLGLWEFPDELLEES